MKISIPIVHPIYPHHPTRTWAGPGLPLPDWTLINNTDDARNPLSEPYRNLIIDARCSVFVHDPHVLEYPDVDIFHELSDVVKGADIVAILTVHDEYFGLDAIVLKGLMEQEYPVVVEDRNAMELDEFVGA